MRIVGKRRMRGGGGKMDGRGGKERGQAGKDQGQGEGRREGKMDLGKL